MAHYKRGRPKSTRAGCLLCKPHKRLGAPLQDRQRFSQLRRMEAANQQIAEAEADTWNGRRMGLAEARSVELLG